MEENFNQQARMHYERAYRQAQRDYSARAARGGRGNLPALDDITEQSRTVAYMKLPQREISLARVAGTYTTSRARSFSAQFLPLHPPGSEFASKWISLCAIHISEGLRDPVQVYEYLWRYYVVEGNKRVSILKYFGAPTVRAEITRVVPRLDENDPETAVYHAYLGYDRTGLFSNIQLSSARNTTSSAASRRSCAALARSRGTPTAMRCSCILRPRTPSPAPCPGDAFVEYLQVYGLPAGSASARWRSASRRSSPRWRWSASPRPSLPWC